MKRYYWLKLKEDFFRQRQIKKLRRIAGGDTFTIIYLKMMLLAMKTNGRIAFDDGGFAEELALEIDEDEDNVKMTVGFLLNTGLMEEVGEGEMYVPEAVANTGSESSSAERVRKFRERQNQKVLQSNANVTLEKEIREKRIEKEIEKDESFALDIVDVARPSDPIPYLKIQKEYNEICKRLPSAMRLSEARKRAIAARWKENPRIETFTELFKKAEASDFLTGGSDKGWKANLDWLLKPANFDKVLEGNYDNRGKKADNRFYDIPEEDNTDEFKALFDCSVSG